MFQFRAFPSYDYFIHRTILEYCSSVLPHSDISGSMLICSSPKLFAAYRVLHRLLMPRHPSCALSSLTYFLTITSSLSNVQIIVATSYGFAKLFSSISTLPFAFRKNLLISLFKKFSYLLLSFFECLLSIQFSMCWPRLLFQALSKLNNNHSTGLPV